MELKTGIENKIEYVVTENDTAEKYGSGMVKVFATPAMISLMEKTCLELVLPFLPKKNNTVGISINIRHIKATPVNMKVTCIAELIEIDNKKLKFKLVAFDEQGEIGNGYHERYIVDTEKFMKNLDT